MKNIVSGAVVSGWLLVLATVGCGDLSSIQAGVINVGYTPDGTLVVSTVAGIKIYDSSLSVERGSITLNANRPSGQSMDVPESFALSTDGRVAAVANSVAVTNDIDTISIPDRARVATIDVVSDLYNPVQGAAVSAHGSFIYAYGQVSEMFAGGTGAALWVKNDPAASLNAPVFAADEQTLYGHNSGRLLALDVHTGEPVFSVDVGGALVGLALLSDGTTLAGVLDVCTYLPVAPSCPANGDGTVRSYVFYSTLDGSLIRQLPAFPATGPGQNEIPSRTLACAPSGDLCASAGIGDGPSAIVVFHADGTLVQRLAGPTTFGIAFSPDSALLATSTGNGTARVYRMSDGGLERERSFDYAVF